MDHLNSSESQPRTGFWGSRYSIGLVALGAIAAYFLLAEHRAHFVGALPLPFLLLLACLLMHVFMHRGHGGHGAGGRHNQREDAEPPAKAKVRGAGGRQ